MGKNLYWWPYLTVRRYCGVWWGPRRDWSSWHRRVHPSPAPISGPQHHNSCSQAGRRFCGQNIPREGHIFAFLTAENIFRRSNCRQAQKLPQFQVWSQQVRHFLFGGFLTTDLFWVPLKSSMSAQNSHQGSKTELSCWEEFRREYIISTPHLD